ncbi:MAG: zf-HC2 domain-containing protein [Coprococcus sp.]|nr:zf-HC2 domain-containing protein [Coprococcus sp.]
MNCLEAQSKIMAFIDNKLPDEELREFIKHVKNCENCAEELEIYYTLIVGMKQLDESDNLSTNFTEELNKKLDEEMTRMTAVKRIATSTIMLIIAAVVVGLVWVYSGVLDKVYRYDQREKLKEQPDYMYSEIFRDRLFKDRDYTLAYLENIYDDDTNEEQVVDEGLVFMESVKSYNTSHINFEDILRQEEDKENEKNIDN